MEEKQEGKMERIQFSPPDIGEQEIAAVVEALRSGWITTGPRTKLLERRIAEQCGTQKAVCLSSATAALELCLRILGVGAGDEVITTAYTYTASASVIAHVGAKIVLVDTQKDGFAPDYDALEAAITERTKVVIPVDIGGVMVDYDRIYDILEQKRSLFSSENEILKRLGRAAILADSAHGFGSSRRGIMSGAAADFTAFSFHAVKCLVTAEGGALTWRSVAGVDDDELYRKLCISSLHGQSKDALAKTQLGAWEYDILSPAYKCNMTDVAAAMGLAQLDRYPKLLARRQELAKIYDRYLKPHGLVALDHFANEQFSNCHLYLCRIPNFTEQQRNALIVRLAERGIATNVHYKPLPLLTAYKNLGFDISDYPNAFNQYQNEITLPLHTLLTDAQACYVAEELIQALNEL